MSRSRKAAVSAAFSYAQFALATASGLFVFPYIVRLIGVYDYGLWLASGELIGYLALLDLGVFAVLPWLIASAAGADDPALIRRHLCDGFAIGVAMGFVLAGAAALIWFAPSASGLVPSIALEKIRGPLVLLLALIAVSYPSKPFAAVLAGLQDVGFTGAAAVCQNGLTVVLTVGLLLTGFGLTGLALALGVPPLLVGVAGTFRLYQRAPLVLQGWGWPRPAGVWHLVSQGTGNWLGSMGTRLILASNGIIMVAVGHPEWVALYAATGKASQILQQACRIIPDSGLIGLAQLYGEGDRRGSKRTVECMLHLHVLISGGAAIGLLSFNPAFVRAWIGPALYAGDYVNILLVANLFLTSLTHVAFTSVGVVGHRLLIGFLSMGCGLIYCGMATALSLARGIEGLTEASLVSTVALGLIPGLTVLGRVHGFGWREVLANAIGPWLIRSAPFLIGAGWLGAKLGGRPAWQPLAAGIILGLAYLWWIRPLIAAVPWPIRARPWLVRLRLIPGVPSGSSLPAVAGESSEGPSRINEI